MMTCHYVSLVRPKVKLNLIIICNVVHTLLNYTPMQTNKLAEAALIASLHAAATEL